MKLALLTGAVAALSLAGAAGARADIIYTTDPYYAGGYVATAPSYVYSAPAPVVVAEPPPAVVVAPPAPAVVGPPVVVAPQPSAGIVTTGYSTHSCYIDFRGIERCY